MSQPAQRILVVKLSSLGDVVHAMPALQDMRQAYAHARIDWVVEPAFAPLLRRCDGVERIIPCAMRRWRRAPLSSATRSEWRAFRTELQAVRYDAVIDLQGLSKSALVSWLARTTPHGRRYALANQTEGSGYEAPTRWVADVAFPMPAHVHAVQRSRLLCGAAMGYAVQGEPHFGLRPALATAGTKLPAAEDATPIDVAGTVALVHGTSRQDKEWPLSHWVDLGLRLNAAGARVALVHGSAREAGVSQAIAAQLNDAIVWPELGLDALVDTLAFCTGVVGVDSGVSHIAVALGLPHVQIYNFDTAWRTGVDNAHQCCVFASPCPDVDAVWAAWTRVAHPHGDAAAGAQG